MTKERYNEIIKRIEDLEETIFYIEMIDHWTREDEECFQKYSQELNSLKAQTLSAIFED